MYLIKMRTLKHAEGLTFGLVSRMLVKMAMSHIRVWEFNTSSGFLFHILPMQTLGSTE